jgi:hypothetical protein
MMHARTFPPRFACAVCAGPVELTCPCGRVSAFWTTAEEVIVLRTPDIEQEHARANSAGDPGG